MESMHVLYMMMVSEHMASTRIPSEGVAVFCRCNKREKNLSSVHRPCTTLSELSFCSSNFKLMFSYSNSSNQNEEPMFIAGAGLTSSNSLLSP